MTRLIALLLAAILAAPVSAQGILPLRLRPIKALQELRQAAPEQDAPAAQEPPEPQGKPVEGDTLGGEPIPKEFEGILTDEELTAIMGIGMLIQQKHVDPVKKKQLFYGALKGMAATLDEHSQFFTPDEAKQFMGGLKGSFGGIGATMGKKEDGKPQPVIGLTPGGPAEKAGVKPGDAILEVNGVDVRGMEQKDIIEKVRGPENTQVTIKVERVDPATKLKSTVSIAITRAVISMPNGFSKMINGNVGYVYFESFRWNDAKDNTAVTVYKMLKDLKAKGASSFVLDVRNNPGGALPAVIALSAAFLKKGETVVIMKDRQGNEEAVKTDRDGDFLGVPTKVLVNGYSASASEILAGALKDNKRGTVVGRQTYGKGSAQTVIPFKDGSMLKLTAQRWYTPNGSSIDKGLNAVGGVAPDVAVTVTDEVEMKAIGNIIREMMGQKPDAAVPDPALDAALGRAPAEMALEPGKSVSPAK